MIILWTVVWILGAVGSFRLLVAPSTASASITMAVSGDRGFGPGYR